MNKREVHCTISLSILQQRMYELLGEQEGTQMTIKRLLPLNEVHPVVGISRDKAYIEEMGKIIVELAGEKALLSANRSIQFKISQYDTLCEKKLQVETDIQILLESLRR